MRTAIAQRTLEVAFLLLCFRDAGAPFDGLLIGWAQKTLWQNNELTPRQLQAQLEEAPS